MISLAEYNRRPGTWWLGKRVRTLRALTPHWMTIPSGTVLVITNKMSGFSLQAEPCSHCGVQMCVSRVPPNALELLPDPDPQPPTPNPIAGGDR